MRRHHSLIWLAAVGCSALPQPVTNKSVVRAPRLPPCGFSELHQLDDAARVVGEEHRTRDKAVWPDGKPSTSVGWCTLHVIDLEKQLYVVRDGDVEIAKITSEGPLLLVPGISKEGFTVGMSTDAILDSHPPEQFHLACWPGALGNQCAFWPVGRELNPRQSFFVGGALRGTLQGLAAYEFFRGKLLRGLQTFPRVD